MNIFCIPFRDITKEYKEAQLKNIRPRDLTLSIFHLDISGNDDIDEQFPNNPLICNTFLVFQLEISGNDIKEVQLKNTKTRDLTLSIFHLEISGKDDFDLQFQNNPSI